MPELLLELLSEEIPARMQDRARADLARLVVKGLQEAGLQPSGNGGAGADGAGADGAGQEGAVPDGVRTFSTPRRIGLSVAGLPARLPDIRHERKGPRVGAPERAIAGFLRSVGLAGLEDCEIREVRGVQFWFAVIERAGGATADALGGIVTQAIRALGWPRSMRWGRSSFQWVRPLHNILCVFDGAPVPGRLDLGGDPGGDFGGDPGGDPGVGALIFNATTSGHRFLAPGKIAVAPTVASAAGYRAALEAAHVLVDPAARRDRIAADARARAAALGCALREDRALLDEVTGLVEWPVAVAGRIDAAFMALPPEVLVTAMRSHQRYFALETADGRMAPHFIAIADMAPADGGAAIAAGNERVLRARLADARFFWDQDRQTPLAARVEALGRIAFHARLGTVRDKAARVMELAGEVARGIGADPGDTARAAQLAKADLTTGMVGEFPELQGVMGRYYALADGESAAVADAIAEHYAPQGPSATCPRGPVSIAVALADKLDTLATFWLIGETPTGSRDPYGLRRAALGIVRLTVENRLPLPLRPLLEQSAVRALPIAATSEGPAPQQPAAAAQQALRFILDRLKVHLRDSGVRHDRIDAAFAAADAGEGGGDLLDLVARVEALDRLLGSEDGGNLLTAWRRAANILRIEEKKAGRRYDGAPAAGLLRLPEESGLAAALEAAAAGVRQALEREAFGDAMTALAALRGPMDRFFDAVKVNDDDPALRENRLLLLSGIRAAMDGVADFSRIEG